MEDRVKVRTPTERKVRQNVTSLTLARWEKDVLVRSEFQRG